MVLREIWGEFKERVLDGGDIWGLTRWMRILSIFLRDLGENLRDL